MSDRKFLLVEAPSWIFKAQAISEAELKRRLLILMDIESCNNWPLAIDILLHGEAVKGESDE